jgi:DnaJ like chaperone protein
VNVQAPVRRATDDIRERAAAIDPELPEALNQCLSPISARCSIVVGWIDERQRLAYLGTDIGQMRNAMAIWGKLIGIVVGFALGQWVGALLGGIAGHAFDQWRAETKARRQKVAETEGPDLIDLDALLETRRVAFATAMVVLAAKLAKVDGRVSQNEIRAFRRTFDISDDDVGNVAAIYNEAKQSPLGFEPFARQVAAVFGTERVVLEELLCGLFEVAVADGAIDEDELRFLREVGSIFGFGPFQFEAIRARYMFSWEPRRPNPAPMEVDHYTVLGLTRAATDDQVKQAWRALVREHHPDRLVAQGLPQEFVDKASRRLAAINAAYDKVSTERGIR